MKIIWEASDFEPEHRSARNLTGFIVVPYDAYAEPWIIGYLAGGEVLGRRFTLTSLRDGRVRGPFNATEIADDLNNWEAKPIIKPIRLEKLL